MIAATEHTLQFRPRLILAHADPAYVAQASRHLQMLGWELFTAASGTEACRLMRALDPGMIVLSTDNHDESGWLTCKKLTSEDPGRKVVLVAPAVSSEDQAFASFVGAAAIVCQDDGMAALVEAIYGTALSAAR